MDYLIGILTVVYVISATLLAIYASGILLLILLWLRHRRKTDPLPEVDACDLPTVLVQLPVYNERAVIGRLIDAVAALDYPRDLLQIQVLDDSTDDTSEVIAHYVAAYAKAGYAITHVQRQVRSGYKAGALVYGLEHADAELIAIFDADFLPSPDFLRKTVPYFVSDARLGLVQTRWENLNPDENLLTRAQALSLDAHFVIEQTARGRSGLLFNFSGSAGVWRKACILEAGNWSSATLAEDLDLSYRAQLLGWGFKYLPDVTVPAEIPPQFAAYRQQQARWAKGSTQNLVRLGARLWRVPGLTVLQRIMGTLHLCQYLVHPLMLLLLLLSPPLLAAGVLEQLPLAPLGLAGLGPPLMYILSQAFLYDDWIRRLLAFPVLLAVGTGLVLNNTLAVLAAFLGRPNVFRRTPKFREQSWQQSSYAILSGWPVVGEIALALYALAGVNQAYSQAPSIAPFLLIYAYAFGVVALWSVSESVVLLRSGHRQVTKAVVHRSTTQI